MELWGLGPKDLERAGLNLVTLRVSGFGQTGPYRLRPGFGTVAEAMSGFAHMNGEEDGNPIFPSTTLADGVAASFGAFGVMAALWKGLFSGRDGVEEVDIGLFEGLYRLIPTQMSTLDQFGYAPKRPGNKLTSHGVLRNLYLTSDDIPFALSAVGVIPMRRVLVAAHVEACVSRLDEGAMVGANDTALKFLNDSDAAVAEWASNSQDLWMGFF